MISTTEMSNMKGMKAVDDNPKLFRTYSMNIPTSCIIIGVNITPQLAYPLT